MKNWYIVQSHSSFENKVAGLIKEEADKAKISDKFEEIIVPTHDVTEVKRGKRIQRKKKYFPGYVFLLNLQQPIQQLFSLLIIPGLVSNEKFCLLENTYFQILLTKKSPKLLKNSVLSLQ